MPDVDDMNDPMEETYLRAEEALDEEAARAARRAKVLAAVAEDQARTPAPAPRGPMRRYGGWLAAACVAGISVITAQQVWRTKPPQVAPPAAKAPAPLADATKAQTAIAPEASPAPPATVGSRPFSRPSLPRPPRQDEPAPAPRAALAPSPPPPPPAPPIPPAADIASPPPLPIPPVQKPIAPLQSAPTQRSFSAAPVAPPAVPTGQAKALVPPPNAGQEIEEVVVTGSRVARRNGAASSPADLEQQSKLREAAAAGRTEDIEALLDQGVAVDGADKDGETALMKSIETDQRDAAALLRRRGADLDLKNRAGASARDMAVQKDDPKLDKALGLSP